MTKILPTSEETAAPDMAAVSKQSEPEATPRSGRRRQESRRKLLAAARTLFVERGYHDTRPQDIARAADVGHGTFYLHFPDKRACFFAFIDEACAELDEKVMTCVENAQDLESRFEGIVSAVVDYHLDNPGVLSAALSNPGVIAAGTDHRVDLLGHWANNWAEKLREQARMGAVYDDYDFDIIGWGLVGLLNPICEASLVTHETRDKVVDNLKRMIARAVMKPV